MTRQTDELLLLTAAQMRAAEAEAMASGLPGRLLMERAGRMAARDAIDMLRRSNGRRVAILCGPGNNGGDGLVVARVLATRGVEVALAAPYGLDVLKGDAAWAAQSWAGPVLPLADLDLPQADLVIDALFGTGLSRDLDGIGLAAVKRVNAASRPVLALDLPSGIDSDTGSVRGAAINATRTIAFAALKPGHLLYPGRAHAGTFVRADIGIGRQTAACRNRHLRLFGPNDPALWAGDIPRPLQHGHKFDRGHALVLSGGGLTTGAARLCARGALRIGVGLVTVAAPEPVLAIHAARLDAIMVRRCNDSGDLASLLDDRRITAVALGPGGGAGDSLAAAARVAIASRRGCVLDADALTSFAGRSEDLAAAIKAAGNQQVVLTPHEGEFARLFGNAAAIDPTGDKVERARAAACLTGAVVVLKGADTLIAASDGDAIINANGTPYLATAGSGDVLAGFITGLMAQGMPAFTAAAAGVWLHGAAGAAFGPGLVADDLPELLPAVLAGLLNRSRDLDDPEQPVIQPLEHRRSEEP